MTTEEFDITDGKKLLYIVFGASRWEFERVEIGTMDIPPTIEGCLEIIRATTFYLLKHWKDIHAEDRAIALDGITHALNEIKESGFYIKGIKRYEISGMSDSVEAGEYAAYLKIIKAE